MEEIKRSTPKFKRGDKVKVMRNEVFTVDEVVTTESKRGITHEYFVDDNMDLLQENELVKVEDTETEKGLKIRPYELLNDGVFGMDSKGEWFVVLNDRLIYQNGIVVYKDDIDDNSCLSFAHRIGYIECLIAFAHSFDDAKNVWRYKWENRNRILWIR